MAIIKRFKNGRPVDPTAPDPATTNKQFVAAPTPQKTTIQTPRKGCGCRK